MFKPILRGLSTFVMVIGFVAGCTGTYALLFQDNLARFGALMTLCLAAVLGGLKMREGTGDVNLVGFTTDELAAHFEIAFALGLGANAAKGRSVFAGMVAAGVIVLALALIGWISARSLWLALLLAAAYGGLLAVIKGRALRQDAFVVKNGRRYGAYRRLNVVLVPAITVVWTVLSAPEADPAILGIIVLGLLWWIGAAFHHAWELLHTTILALLYGEKNPEAIRWGLIEWLEHTRADVKVQEVHYDPSGQVRVHGEFANPAELRRELSRLDFVTAVELLPARASGSA